MLVKRVFSRVYEGVLPTTEAQRLIHLFCNQKGLNPAGEMPITMLMLTEMGQERLQKYEAFLMNLNWVIAKLAAKEISIYDAVTVFTNEMNALPFCRENVSTQDEFLDEYFNARLWCASDQNIY